MPTITLTDRGMLALAVFLEVGSRYPEEMQQVGEDNGVTPEDVVSLCNKLEV